MSVKYCKLKTNFVEKALIITFIYHSFANASEGYLSMVIDSWSQIVKTYTGTTMVNYSCWK